MWNWITHKNQTTKRFHYVVKGLWRGLSNRYDVVLMMLGHNPVTDDVYDEELDSTTQSDQGKRSDVTLAQLVEAGLVTVGEELVSNMKKWPATARVGEHGKIEFNGEKYDKPSNPAQAVREGKSTNGWTFWAVQRGSEKVILNRLREQFEHSNEGTKM